MTIKKFEDIIAWQKVRELNKELNYSFVDLRNFTFKDQILRAGLSINNNIAEGFERSGDKELKYFLHVARGSAAEVRSMLYMALDMKYIEEARFQELYGLTVEVGRLITGFIKKL
ncbi:MAG: four helix bundle protein [Patescibacteria group bacterium]